MLSSKKLTCKGTLRQLFIRVYRLDTGDTVSHVGIFDPALWTVAALTFFPPPLSTTSLCQSTLYTDSVWLGGGGVLSPAGDHILQEFITINVPLFKKLRDIIFFDP